jgi:hypothetical protein
MGDTKYEAQRRTYVELKYSLHRGDGMGSIDIFRVE